MELMLFIRVLLRRWYMIVIPVAIVAAFTVPGIVNPQASGGGFSTSVRYTASQVLDALPERDGDYQDVWRASELAVNAFTEWIVSSSFADEVGALLAERGDITIEPALLRGKFIGENFNSIGRMTINWPGQGEAARAELVAITDAALVVLQTRNSAYFPQLGDVPAEVEILDEPIINVVPPSLTSRFEPLLRLGLAVVAGVGLALLVEYLDPMLRRREQLEAMRLHVIATIPRE